MNTKAQKKSGGSTIWSRMFVTLCIINLFQSIGQMMMNTILPLYVYEMGATASVVGIVVGAFAVTALISRPFATPAFESFSKKKLLFASELLFCACSFLYGFADSVPMLIAVRMIHGVAMGCAGPLVLTLVTEQLPPDRLGSGVSTFSLTQALSQALGPALGLWLIDLVGYQWTFRISGITMVIATLLVLTITERKRDNRPAYKISLKRCFAKEAIPPSVVASVLAIANTSVMSFIAIYAGLMGIEQIGLYFTVHALVMVATRPLFGRLADKAGFTKVIIPTMVLYALSFVLIGFSNSLWMFILAAIITAIGFGASSPLFQALAMGSVERERGGAAGSTNFTGIDIAMLFGPILCGGLAQGFRDTTGSELQGYSFMFIAVTAIVVVAIVLYMLFRKTISRNMKKAARVNAELYEKEKAEAQAAKAALKDEGDESADEATEAPTEAEVPTEAEAEEAVKEELETEAKIETELVDKDEILP